MKYKLVHTGRQAEYCYFDSWQINGYEIALEMRVGAGIRVNVRRPPSDRWLHYWFCGGETQAGNDRPQTQEADILQLLNVAIELIENDILHTAPATTARPFTKDVKFCRFIKPYQRVYVKELNFENLIGGYCDIIERFSTKKSASDEK